jgi:hypothetical protein
MSENNLESNPASREPINLTEEQLKTLGTND